MNLIKTFLNKFETRFNLKIRIISDIILFIYRMTKHNANIIFTYIIYT